MTFTTCLPKALCGTIYPYRVTCFAQVNVMVESHSKPFEFHYSQHVWAACEQLNGEMHAKIVCTASIATAKFAHSIAPIMAEDSKGPTETPANNSSRIQDCFIASNSMFYAMLFVQS